MWALMGAAFIEDSYCMQDFNTICIKLSFLPSDCSLDVPTDTLDSTTTCVVKETCSAVDCCTDVDFLNRPFHTYLYLDPCDLTFTIGIENFVFNASLTSDPDFEFGRYPVCF